MRLFRRCLLAAMRARWITIAVTAALFVAALAGTRFVPEQFFPASDRPELLVDLKLQDNASILATRDVSAEFDKVLAADPDVVRFSTYVGQGAIRFYLPIDVALPNDFFAQSVVVTKGLKERDQVRARLEQTLAERFPEVVARVYPLELGPPVGWPVKYRISGPDPSRLHAIAMQVAELLGGDRGDAQRQLRLGRAGARHAHPHRPGPGAPTQPQLAGRGARAERRGVAAARSRRCATASTWSTWSTRAEQAQRTSLETIRSLQIPLPSGKVVPLRQIASFDYTQEYPIVWRRDRVPTLTVQADVAPGLLPADRGAGRATRHRPARGDAAERLPHRDRRVGGGKRQGQGVRAGGRAGDAAAGADHPDVPAQSFQRVFLVLSVAPLGLIGVVAALLLAQKPLGFVAILGVLALTGMIARNAVILIDQIEKERAAGMHPWDAVVIAAIHRTRPILLTASATVLAMIPIAPSVFWGSMAFSIIGGLAGATVLTLIFLPALYVAWFRIREPVAGDAVMPPRRPRDMPSRLFRCLRRAPTAIRLAAGAAMVAAIAPCATAADPLGGLVDEVRVGAVKHDANIFGDGVEKGTDINGELLFVTPIPAEWADRMPPWLRWVAQPRPHVGGLWNTDGATSQGYAGLTWMAPSHTACSAATTRCSSRYTRGGAVNDGYAHASCCDRKSVGSNVLFRVGAGVGYSFTPHFSLVAAWFDEFECWLGCSQPRNEPTRPPVRLSLLNAIGEAGGPGQESKEGSSRPGTASVSGSSAKGHDRYGTHDTFGPFRPWRITDRSAGRHRDDLAHDVRARAFASVGKSDLTEREPVRRVR